MPFNFQVLQGVEQGLLIRNQALEKYGIQARSTIRIWLKKYGKFDYNVTINQAMSKSSEWRILELERQVKL